MWTFLEFLIAFIKLYIILYITVVYTHEKVSDKSPTNSLKYPFIILCPAILLMEINHYINQTDCDVIFGLNIAGNEINTDCLYVFPVL